MERQVLIANDGMVLTNGEIYGKEIYLADGIRADTFYKITQAEYDEIMAQEETESPVEKDELADAIDIVPCQYTYQETNEKIVMEEE